MNHLEKDIRTLVKIMTNYEPIVQPALKIIVFVSGNGSNLQAIINAIDAKLLCAEICLVLSNEPRAYALERAKQSGLPIAIVDHHNFESRQKFELTLLEKIHFVLNGRVERCVLVLAGFMRILSPLFLERFPHKIINIHPSLLPLFPGTHAIKRALNARVKKTGCTIHEVTTGLDEGPILAQLEVPVFDEDTEDTLTERMHAAEHTLLVQVLQKMSFCC